MEMLIPSDLLGHTLKVTLMMLLLSLLAGTSIEDFGRQAYIMYVR